jgi:hypothetical protein
MISIVSMNLNNSEETELSELIRRSRPEATLPAGFANSVWRRIEKQSQPTTSPPEATWLEVLVNRLFQPRVAWVGIAAVIFLGAVSGAMNGSALARQAAQDRYLAVVAPHHIR